MKAFPSEKDSNKCYEQRETGMDLRDYFACNAPIYMDEAFESLGLSTKTTMTDKYDKEVFDEIARMSYAYADAMMKARNENN